ncbi:ribose-phosphate diphosphokinase [Clostridium sp. DL1XJH146]
MITHGKDMKLFTGNSNKPLAKEICDILETNLGKNEVATFSDGEISVNTYETVRGLDVYVIQSTSEPVNNNLMELLIMIDAFKRASAARIIAVIPYYAYARQDRKVKARDPITAKLVADMLTSAGASRVLTLDLHASQIQGYFNIPVDNLFGEPIIGKYFLDKGFSDRDDIVIVAPDPPSVPRVRKLATRLDASIAIIDKRKTQTDGRVISNIIGEVAGKTAILMDDICDTGTRMSDGSRILKEHGVKEIYATCSHGVLSGEAIEKINNSPIKEFVILNTIEQPEKNIIDKLTILSVAPLMAEAIRRIYDEKPVSNLYI